MFLKKHPGLLDNGPAAPQVDLTLLIDGFPQVAFQVMAIRTSYLVQLLKLVIATGLNEIHSFFCVRVCV